MEDTRYTGETLRRRGLIFASAAVASMLSWRAGRVEGEAEMPCTSPLPPPLAPIFIRVSARPTCIINVAQIVRGQVGVRGAIALESNAGFRQKCCIAVCELARSFARYKLRPGFAHRCEPRLEPRRAPLSLVCMYACVYTRVYTIVVTYRDFVVCCPLLLSRDALELLRLLYPRASRTRE